MSKKINSNTLDIQKNRLKRIAIDYLGVALLFLLLSVIVLVCALTIAKDETHAKGMIYIVIPMLLIFCIVFLFFSAKRFFLLHSFKQARLEKEVNITINCKSVRFITYATARGLIEDVVGIVLTDVNRKKYTYILPKNVSDSKNLRVNARQNCTGNTVELVCYKETNLIKRCTSIDSIALFTH